MRITFFFLVLRSKKVAFVNSHYSSESVHGFHSIAIVSVVRTNMSSRHLASAIFFRLQDLHSKFYATKTLRVKIGITRHLIHDEGWKKKIL